MNKNHFFLIFSIFLIFISCNDDDAAVQDDPTGNIEVTILSSDNIPEQGVVVNTDPITTTLITNDLGVAAFSNIPVGEYKILLSFPSNSSSFNPEGIIQISSVIVTENATESISYMTPSSVSEVTLNIDFLLSSTYNKLRETLFYDNSGYQLYWGDIGSDIVYVNTNVSGQNLSSLDRYDISPSNQIINNIWAEYYGAVRFTNLGLDAIAESDYDSPSNRNETELEAEFRFLRALLYFNLVKLYGNPFLVSTAKIAVDEPFSFTQDTEGVHNLIEEDLKFAEANLTTSKISKTASTYAAQTLLGKFYLYLGGFPNFQTDKYQLAINQFEKTRGQYSLEENYADVFSVANEASNSEVIFTIPFESGDENTGGNTGVRWGPLGYALNDLLLLDKSFIEDYFSNPEDIEAPIAFPLTINDTRFSSNIASFIVVGEKAEDETDITNWRPFKFINDITIAPQVNNSSENFPLLRYADVLLMLAEAENAINGPTQKAYDAVNEVINRSISAGGELPVGLNQSDFLLEILKQRKLEFCFEGQYKDDLIRNELLETIISDFNVRNPSIQKQYDSHEHIWPIPQSEINIIPNAIQNPGY